MGRWWNDYVFNNKLKKAYNQFKLKLQFWKKRKGGYITLNSGNVSVHLGKTVASIFTI